MNSISALSRSLVVFAGGIATLCGQDRLVEFDVGETGGPSDLWFAYAIGVGFCLVGIFLWRHLIRFLEVHRSTIKWKAASIGLPTAMLVLLAMMMLWPNANRLPETLIGCVVILNLPVLPAIALAALVIPGSIPVSWRVSILAGCYWIGWHLVVRFLRWRAWESVSIALKIDAL